MAREKLARKQLRLARDASTMSSRSSHSPTPQTSDTMIEKDDDILEIKMIVRQQLDIIIENYLLKIENIFYRGFDLNITALESIRRSKRNNIPVDKITKILVSLGIICALQGTKIQKIINSPRSTEDLKKTLRIWRREFNLL